MFLDNPALRQLKNTFESEKVRKDGNVKLNDRGFGFLELDNKDSVFIAPNDTKSVMTGDRITAIIESSSDGKKHAIPEKLVEPFLSRFVGQVLYIGGKLNVTVDHPNIKSKILATDKRADTSVKLNNGDWVICNLTHHALKNKVFRASLDELICAKNDPRAPWKVSLRRYDLPLQEPADEEFNYLEDNLPHEDLTNIPFITIDSAHTEDMDDALYIEKNEQGFKLFTAIADPTGYISEDSKLNSIAANRSFSIYLPGQDIPMLPRALSDNLCSLREGELRNALVGTIHVGFDGQIDFTKTEFKLAHIKSHGKLIYNEVSDYLEGIETSFKPNETIANILKLLKEFSDAREQYRNTHAAAFKNRPDYDFILKENGALDHIELNFRRSSNKIVEEAMIVSNVAAGNLLAEKFESGIFNLHEGFDLKKKKELIALLEKEKCPFDEDKLESMEQYNAIRRFAVNNDNDYLDSRIRRLQAFSEIAIAPGPHYALGVNNYATWTSPIRKYGDMVNHRLLKAIAVNTVHPTLPGDELLKIMNLARRTNRMAERDVRDWLYVEFLEPEIAKKTVFKATIFDISRGGLRVLLDDNGAMVFVPFTMISLSKEDLVLSQDTGEILVKGEVVNRLGDQIEVRVVEINKQTRSIVAAPAKSIGGLILPDPEQLKAQASKPKFKRR